MCVARLLPVVLVAMSVLSPSNVRAEDPKSPGEYGLAAGKKMPFLVADFLGGKNRNRRGCPSVMIANSGGRGLIIWSRGAVDSAFQFAKALEADAADGDKLQRFLVVFDADDRVLSEKADSLGRFVVGKPRHSAKVEFDRRGVDAKVVVLVFLLDKKDIKFMWSFAADELSNDKVKELAAAVKQVATGDK